MANLKEVLGRFCESARRDARQLVSEIDDLLKTGRPTKSQIYTVVELAHTIKGSAGTLGFDLVSDRALRLETTLRTLEAHRQIASVSRVKIRMLAGSLRAGVTQMRPNQSRFFALNWKAVPPRRKWGKPITRS